MTGRGNTMSEIVMQKQLRRAKMRNMIIIFLFASMVISALIGFSVYRYQHTFTLEKWFRAPDNRTNIVADLLEKLT